MNESNRTFRIIVFGAFGLAIVFCAAGIWLVYLGATGATEFKFFGQSFHSGNVGIAALFLGAASAVLLLRRTLRSLDAAIRTESVKSGNYTPPTYWPRTRTLKSLGLKINSLSDNQWTVLKTIATTPGLRQHRLAEITGMGPSLIFLRVRGLIDDDLVGADYDLYLSEGVIDVLGNKSIEDLRH